MNEVLPSLSPSFPPCSWKERNDSSANARFFFSIRSFPGSFEEGREYVIYKKLKIENLMGTNGVTVP